MSDSHHGFSFSYRKSTSEGASDKSSFSLSLHLGEAHAEYSNDTLGELFKILLEYQKLNVFREVQLIHRFFSETSQRR